MIAISYRREDSLPIAGRLYDRLQAEFGKASVFMDFDSIPPGVDFREHIKQAIGRSTLVIAIIGPDWLGGHNRKVRRIDDPEDFVRLEIAYAIGHGIPVIPILINQTPMPQAEELPVEMRAIAFRNALTLDSGIDFHHHADRLIKGIRSGIGAISDSASQTAALGSPSPVSPNHREKRSSEYLGSSSKRKLMICIAVVIFVGAIWCLIWFLTEPPNAETMTQQPTAPHIPPLTTPEVEIQPSTSPKVQVQPTATTEVSLESRLIGKWQGPRHLIELFDDHTFAQSGLRLTNMTWRLDGEIIIRFYPDLGKDIPAWYPGVGPVSLKIVSVTGDRLVTENDHGARFVEYRITLDNPDEREGAAARAKADTLSIQPKAGAQSNQAVASAITPSRLMFAGVWTGDAVTSNGPRTKGTIKFTVASDEKSVMLGEVRCSTNKSGNTLSWSYSRKAENSGSFIGTCTLRLLRKDQASFLQTTIFTEGVVKGSSGPVWSGTLNRK